MFILIKQCTVAKNAWQILKTAHEGTTKVKSAKLQLLTTKFENLKMLEDECIQDYHLNILDIVNAFDSLGEKISDEKLERKILRSVPKRFDMKVTAIEEAQDISSIKVDELVGSLQSNLRCQHKWIIFVAFFVKVNTWGSIFILFSHKPITFEQHIFFMIIII